MARGACGEGGLGLTPLSLSQTRAWLQTDLLSAVAQEVEYFSIGDKWKPRKDQDQPENTVNQLLYQPHVLLYKMSALTSVRVQRALDSATFDELVSQCNLVCLELASFCCTLSLSQNYFIQQLCSMRGLSKIDLGTDPPLGGEADDWQEGFNSQSLRMLGSGRIAGLQELAIPLAAGELQHLNMLTALTALTSLDVESRMPSDKWSVLTTLTGLKNLRMAVSRSTDLEDPAEATLTPLTALLRLTCLDIVKLDRPTEFGGKAHRSLGILRCCRT